MQILAVVVLYKRALAECQTIQGLTASFERHPGLLDSIGVLIWDNSPLPLTKYELPFPFEYRHCDENIGVSGAYNRALKIAESYCCPWLLLLDQDTEIPEHYLGRMQEYSRELGTNSEIAAIAPFLMSSTRVFSPAAIRFYGIRVLSPPFSGVHPREVFAANSGALMRVAALREIGGYDEDFWLDHSDIVVFHRFHLRGKRLYVAGDLELQHLSALNDYDGSMSPDRYRSFLGAESAYCDLYRSSWENAIQALRLFARSIKQYLLFENKEFSRITRQGLRDRLRLTKTQRLIQWKQQLSKRNLPMVTNGRVVG